jgi:RNA polymerase sigma factor (sigma-70 family)
METLVQRLKSDDQTALLDILKLYGDQALRWMLSRGLRREYAEEALEDALYKLWRLRATFDPARSTIEQWFLMLCRQAAVDASRRLKVNPFNQLADPEGIPDRAPAEEEPASTSERREDLDTALSELSDIDRTIALRRAEGGNWAVELAKELGMETNAVRVRGLRVTEKIRARMEELRAARTLLACELGAGI